MAKRLNELYILCKKKTCGKSGSNLQRLLKLLYCESFEPRSHFISRLSMIVRVDVVLKRTVAVTVNDVSTTYAVVIIRVGKVSCITSVDGFKLWFLT